MKRFKGKSYKVNANLPALLILIFILNSHTELSKPTSFGIDDILSDSFGRKKVYEDLSDDDEKEEQKSGKIFK